MGGGHPCILFKSYGEEGLFTVSHFPEHKKVEQFLNIGCFSGSQGSGKITNCQWLIKKKLLSYTSENQKSYRVTTG